MSETNEVPIISHIWLASTTLNSSKTFKKIVKYWKDFSQLRICKPPPPHLSLPQKWYHFNRRFAMCRNKWKIKFSIFWAMINFVLKIHRKCGKFEYKNDHISKTKNRKNDFSFVAAYSASFMYIWPFLKNISRKTLYLFEYFF